MIGKGTFGSGTFIVEGHDFIAQRITFENSAVQVKSFFSVYFHITLVTHTYLFLNVNDSSFSHSKGSGQAVAIRVSADRCAFYKCRFLGWQVH